MHRAHLDLLEEGRDVHDNAVTDDSHRGGVQHAGGQEVELKGLLADHDRVPRIRPAGNARADVVTLRQDVHLLNIPVGSLVTFRFGSNIVSVRFEHRFVSVLATF